MKPSANAHMYTCVKPKVVREEEVGGARLGGLDSSPLPPILDNEGNVGKFERHWPTPENAKK